MNKLALDDILDVDFLVFDSPDEKCAVCPVYDSKHNLANTGHSFVPFNPMYPQGVHGVWVVGTPEVVDGIEWWPVDGGMNTEYVRIKDHEANGNPHIVPVYGTDRYGDYEFSVTPEIEEEYFAKHPEAYEVEPKWVPCWPTVRHGFDWAEYDADYGDAYDTFAEAVSAGLAESEKRRSKNGTRSGL